MTCLKLIHSAGEYDDAQGRLKCLYELFLALRIVDCRGDCIATAMTKPLAGPRHVTYHMLP